MASQGAVLHAEYEELSAIVGYGIRRAGIVGVLTNANILSATSAEDLEVIVEAGLPPTVHAEYEVEQIMTDLSLKRGDALGDFSNSRVAAADTIAGLVNSTNAADDPDTGHLGPQIV